MLASTVIRLDHKFVSNSYILNNVILITKFIEHIGLFRFLTPQLNNTDNFNFYILC